MAGTTAHYGWHKPAPSENVDVDTDINANLDDMDTELFRVDGISGAVGNVVREWTRVISAAGVVHNDVAGTETNIPKLAVENINIINNSVYKFEGTFFVNGSVAGNVFYFRVRKDTPVDGAGAGGGTIIAQWPYFVPGAGLDDAETFSQKWKATAGDVDGDFYVSCQRLVGAGVLDIVGDRKTCFSIETKPLAISNYIEA